jgi:hypothetical protein
LSDIVGSYPERETNDRATLNACALIGADFPRPPGFVIRRRKLTLERLMGRSDVGTVLIWGEQIDAHAPELHPVTHPAH